MPKVPNAVWGLVLTTIAYLLATYYPDAPWLQAVNLVVVALLKALEVNIVVEEPVAHQDTARGLLVTVKPEGKLKRWWAG